MEIIGFSREVFSAATLQDGPHERAVGGDYEGGVGSGGSLCGQKEERKKMRSQGSNLVEAGITRTDLYTEG